MDERYPLQQDQPSGLAPSERLSRLSAEGRITAPISRRYSKFVKYMRVVLPLVAVGLTVVVFTWDDAGHKIQPIRKEELSPNSKNARNELLHPKFESVDENQQPFSVIADRAIQDRENPDLLNLEKPVADMNLKDGASVSANAARGVYQQQSQKLNLEGDVHLHYSTGYTLTSEELRVDLLARKSYSDLDVRVEGPAGTLDAKGLEGDSNTGVLIFSGPAKLILYNDQSSAPSSTSEAPLSQETPSP